MDTPVPATAIPGSEVQNVSDLSHHQRNWQMCSVKKSIDARTWSGTRQVRMEGSTINGDDSDISSIDHLVMREFVSGPPW